MASERRDQMMIDPTSPWNPRTDAILTKNWNDGLPSKDIGKLIGVTKNSVIGRARRIGLPKRQSPIKFTEESVAKKAANSKAFYENREIARRQIGEIVAIAWGRTVKASRYRADGCQYITNPSPPYVYCGKDVDHSVYCGFHASLCFLKPIKVLGKVS